MRFRHVPTATCRASIERLLLAARLLLATTLLAAPLLAGGCGPRRPALVPVSGIVTLAGRPLSGGFVRVVPAESRAATGRIGPDGRFTLGTFAEADGCVTGTHGVAVLGPLPKGGETVAAVPEPAVAVPARYREAATSGLTITITGPTSDLVIALTPGDDPDRRRAAPAR